jgi:hypothetical protein
MASELDDGELGAEHAELLHRFQAVRASATDAAPNIATIGLACSDKAQTTQY